MIPLAPETDVDPTFISRPVSSDGAFRIVRIKQAASLLLSELKRIPVSDENGRLINLARTHLEDSVMWAVKAVSRETISQAKVSEILEKADKTKK